MVWGGDIVASSQRSSRSNVDLEIGCLVDLAMGMLSFSANGKELGTCYQVGVASGAELLLWALGFGPGPGLVMFFISFHLCHPPQPSGEPMQNTGH